MKRIFLLLAVVLLAAALSPAQRLTNQVNNRPKSTSASAEAPEFVSKVITLTGKVVAVSEGDTITILDGKNRQHKIRLENIDAPEKNQPFGDRSKQNLSDLLFGKEVMVAVNKQDRHGYYVGVVYLDGSDINYQQIKAGLAWHYKKYAAEQDEQVRRVYAKAEETARKEGAGLWADKEPTPPWDFRLKNDVEAAINPSESGSHKNASPAAAKSSAAPKTYIRSSRGSCYYLDSNGNKSYVDRSLCN